MLHLASLPSCAWTTSRPPPGAAGGEAPARGRSGLEAVRSSAGFLLPRSDNLEPARRG